ncbi:GntR family transcriptional regulator [Micromonospora zamorensis]|uniref:GntR family transcriptional regulator n=1 Tax=Micromonospora zamorensis TaxID=709883 RepID=UPI0037B397F7
MPYEQPLWRQIRDDLRAKIKAGIFPAGSKLPSVRLLADEYDTSHMTVRRAVDTMIESVELIGRAGRGIFVSATNARGIEPSSD